ncbi:TatD family hydrolase [Lacticigenium naphthae]|uniref:TatD family hydrolase n=1 Tax=Lacticigenium naphthae TaxID=515351 RepID=UPI00042571EE|nr:TatD family hydrolase [Lacticigenium naphthae]
MLFDTHTHLNVPQLFPEAATLIEHAKELQVSRMAVVGFDTETIEKSLELSNTYDSIYSIIGWHPTEAATYTDKIEEQLVTQLQLPKVVAMGEMGLDYYWDSAPKSVQHDVFRRQMRVAKELKLPVSIHMREATEDTYRILKEEHVEDMGGIMHSFNVDTYWMEAFLDLGMHISLNGIVTFKNAPEVKEVAKAVPKDKLLIETDAPYLTPAPYRGRRNEPAYVRYVAEEIARLREVSLEEIGKQTTENALKLFTKAK